MQTYRNPAVRQRTAAPVAYKYRRPKPLILKTTTHNVSIRMIHVVAPKTLILKTTVRVRNIRISLKAKENFACCHVRHHGRKECPERSWTSWTVLNGPERPEGLGKSTSTKYRLPGGPQEMDCSKGSSWGLNVTNQEKWNVTSSVVTETNAWWDWPATVTEPS
jgi:hypothetical protein